MLEEKRLKEIENRVKNFIREGTIQTKKAVEDVDFFIKNSEDSLQSAQCLFDIATKKDYPGYEELKSFLWVINASYYSMFYMTRALLEYTGIKLKSDLSIHTLAFDALVYYFYLTGKLQKKLFEYYAEAKEDAAELLGQKKADQLVEEYFYEKTKRASFTYETGEFAMESKAKTSLQRAIRFNKEIKRIIREEKK